MDTGSRRKTCEKGVGVMRQKNRKLWWNPERMMKNGRWRKGAVMLMMILTLGLIPYEGMAEPKSHSQTSISSGLGTLLAVHLQAQSKSYSDIQPESQSEARTGSQSELRSESQPEAGSESQPEAGSESQPEAGSESRPEAGSESHSEAQSESASGLQSEMPSQSEALSETESETGKSNWPQGQYLVQITDAAVSIPPEGRFYDGTDRIEITYKTQIVRVWPSEEGGDGDEQSKVEQAQSAAEEIPEYHVTHTAHLESTDSGERRVICSFCLQTPHPEHVKLDETTANPDLRVNVQKAVLSVKVSDGVKHYGDAADMEHIELESPEPVSVSGFVTDASGEQIIPQGFELPQITVDPSVLEQYSPIYEQADEALSKALSVKRYENALVLKKDPQGNVTGNPTANYEFCQNPDDPRCSLGTVVIKRSEAKKDVTYVLKGEKGAYRFEEDGTVIVKAGTSLTAEPVQGQGYNTGFRKENITQSGTITFRMERRSKDGVTVADSKEVSVRVRADRAAPKAEITLSKATSSGGTYFSSSDASFAIHTPEDENGGKVKVLYRVLSAPVSAESVRSALGGNPALSPSSSWEETGTDANVNLSQEQICAVEVQVVDSVGNVSREKSQTVIIDRGSPQIELKGVTDKSANASGVKIVAQCLDPSYLPGSLKAELSADFAGVIPKQTLEEGPAGVATISFEDFPMRKEADSIYRLNITAKDRAGNSSRKQISFSVNRFGSSYSLSDSTSEKLKKYYHAKPFDVTFIESNLDEVGSARVLLRSGKSLRELRNGSGLTMNSSQTEKGTSRYTYTVSASSFQEDGPYEVMLLTTDRAGNSSDSSAQRLPVRFAIDSTNPECLISGISPEGRYNEEEMTAVIETRDNLALSKAEVYLNAQKKGTWTASQLAGSEGIIKCKLLKKKQWQTLQVHVQDMAGNETWTQEIPVYISSEDAQDAEDYRQVRLSAQQMDLLMQFFKNIQSRLTGFGMYYSRIFGTAGVNIVSPTPSKAVLANTVKTETYQNVKGSNSDPSGKEALHTSSHQQLSQNSGGSLSQDAGSLTVQREENVAWDILPGIILAVTMGLAAVVGIVFWITIRQMKASARGADPGQWGAKAELEERYKGFTSKMKNTEQRRPSFQKTPAFSGQSRETFGHARQRRHDGIQ